MDDTADLSEYTQASRLLRIDTPLGDDALLLERFEGREAVNELFDFKAAVRAKRDDVKPQELIGKNVRISLDAGQGNPRRVWDCLVVGITEEPRLAKGFRRYVLTLRPDLWLLGQKSDCRIWLGGTSVEIAQTLLSEHGLRAPDVAGVLGQPAAQSYSVQFNERDLDYLLRRLEEDGLFYWIRQTAEGQQLVLSDTATRWDAGADGQDGATRFAIGSTDREHINRWDRHFAFTPGKRAGRDWNFETPTAVPAGDTPSLVNLPRNGAYELYEYPSRRIDSASSETSMKLRMQAVEADHERIEAASSTRTLAPGAKVTPYDVADPDQTFETAVVTAIEHFADGTSYETGGEHPVYHNRFDALPARLPLTPHRATLHPRIDGTQIAIVAGPPGEEIHTEQYGRIKLWFPWDRRAKKDGSDTVWIRVGQSWSGGQWGSQVIPRIGMEVAVSYLDGDPDRPLVVGIVPNPVNAVPYDLPANKTRMTLRSNTHKGQGFNELSMEDEAGRENLFLHAQKDMTERVLNDHTSRIDRHEVASVGGNRAFEVAGNEKQEIGGSMNLTVGGTGVQALGLLAQVAGMGGQTSQLLAQAGQIAGGGGPGLAAFAGTIATSALGFLTGSGLASRDGVASGPSPRADAGTALAGSGSGLGEAAGSLFPLPGIMNTVVGSFKSDTVGVACTEQIGLSKVTNVGQTQVTSVGKTKRTTVGERYELKVGSAIVTTTETHTSLATKRLVLSAPGGVIEINEEGVFIRAKRLQMKASSIEFLRGSDGATDKPFKEDCSKKG